MKVRCLIVILTGAFALPVPREKFRVVKNSHEESSVKRGGSGGNHTHYYCDQLVDHFAEDSAHRDGTWCQKYLYNDQFLTPDRCRRPVVLLYTGGESPSLNDNVVTKSNVADDMISLAKEIGAVVMALEHRYYGEEKPTRELSREVLERTFTSDQALADLARFRDYAADKYNLGDAQFVTFGGSYPGVVAAWARAVYPQKFVAAVSSSAPIEARLDFPEYNDAVGVSFASELAGGSIGCASAVRRAHEEVGRMLEVEEGRRELERAFNVCGTHMLDDIDNRKVWTSEGVFGFSVQSNDPGCDSDLCNIDKICRYFTDPDLPESLVERLAHVSRARTEECVDVDFNKVIKMYKNESDADWIKMWTFQTCNEFGFYQTCDSSKNCLWTPGLNDLEWNTRLCRIGWGFTTEEVAANIDRTSCKRGGLSLNATRILSVNGGVDPWHRLALVTSDDPALPTIWVPGASHHYWTHHGSENVDKSVARARAGIRGIVKQWLREDARAILPEMLL
ncbi:Thymus-specific serine protease [Perkinsus olseni]|uniref:Thymus-specific serine protease n=1 Tax=Perkinsus olseni TaxID=32597 RepID=A0A7J6MXB8_PEROL|nr:Thymus-specific serine protease [Perkinsus olseni]KAF4675997.1 Thymus-specific serine protease [Perkinsus olseni]